MNDIEKRYEIAAMLIEALQRTGSYEEAGYTVAPSVVAWLGVSSEEMLLRTISNDKQLGFAGMEDDAAFIHICIGVVRWCLDQRRPVGATLQ